MLAIVGGPDARATAAGSGSGRAGGRGWAPWRLLDSRQDKLFAAY